MHIYLEPRGVVVRKKKKIEFRFEGGGGGGGGEGLTRYSELGSQNCLQADPFKKKCWGATKNNSKLMGS